MSHWILKTKRSIPSRRASVLILVVALLVLMALLGTAYISSTRVERASAIQHNANTQIDIVTDGVVNSLQQAMVNDLVNPTGQFMGAQPLTGPTNNYDSALSKIWLADRIPEQRDLTSDWLPSVPATANPNPDGWKSIGWPLIPGPQGFEFDSPYSATPILPAKDFGLSITTWSSGGSYAADNLVAYPSPSFGTFYRCLQASTGNNPASSPTYWKQVDIKQYFRFEPTVAANGAGALNVINTFYLGSVPPLPSTFPIATSPFALDADGDGIPDSLPWKVASGPIDGITYYAATRVVDNAAVINANTATSLISDADKVGAPLQTAGASKADLNPSFWPTNVGIKELMNPNAQLSAINVDQFELDQLTLYRANITIPQTSPFHDTIDVTTNQPFADDLTKRTDFEFTTQASALYSQLSRRTGNPGYNSVSSPDTKQYQSFPILDELSLANKFCVNDTTLATTQLGTILQFTINGNTTPSPANPITDSVSPTQAYNLSGGTPVIDTWFRNNFWFGPQTSAPATEVFYRPLRPLLTTYNPVSVRGAVAAAQRANKPVTKDLQSTISRGMLPYEAATWLPATHAYLEWVEFTTPSVGNKPRNEPKLYMCVKPAGTLATDPSPDSAPGDWLVFPSSSTNQKTNINTADFRELWRSYFTVMSSNGANAPLAITATSPAIGQRMFKSSIRPNLDATSKLLVAPAPTRLTDLEQVELRSAIAAANAEGLRSGKDDVISHNIDLYDLTGAATRSATVYSQQKQPFITEVCVHADNAGKPDYVAIELFNPYPALSPKIKTGPTFDMGSASALVPDPAIKLGCVIGLVDRSTGLVELVPHTWLATELIPPQGYLILESSSTDRKGFKLPAGATVTVELANLLHLFYGTGGTGTGMCELVLARTRTVDGLISKKDNVVGATFEPDPSKRYTEAATLPTDFSTLVPFEQFDFSNWGGATQVVTPASQYDYVRPTPQTPLVLKQDNLLWRCVFPLAPAIAAIPPDPNVPGDPGVPAIGGGQYAPGNGGLMSGVTPIADTDTTNKRFGGSLGTFDPLMVPGYSQAQRWPVIQLNAMDWPGPTPTPLASAPFGGFARLGDVLQVPYIGAYHVFDAGVYTGTPQETMSVSMDSLYAQSGNETTDPIYITANKGNAGMIPDQKPAANGEACPIGTLAEQIGRFCPLAAMEPERAVKRHDPDLSNGIATYSADDDYYWWASHLFDCITVLTPQEQYFPSADPTHYPTTIVSPWPVNGLTTSLPPYLSYGTVKSVAGKDITLSDNMPIFNDLYDGCVIQFLTGKAAGQCVVVDNYAISGSSAPLTRIATVNVNISAALAANDVFRIIGNPIADAQQGLININTAPWKVLSMLPMVRSSVDGSVVNITGSRMNDELARMIVSYRNEHGPFKSIFDLNKVIDPTNTIGFQTGYKLTSTATTAIMDFSATRATPIDARQGDYSPLDATAAIKFPQYDETTGPEDNVIGDFEERALAINRISNMITTRSDGYTCYVLVQGYRNAGTANATLVSQRRIAFLVDRSAVGATNKTCRTLRVPSN